MKITIIITHKWNFKIEARTIALAKERAKELMKITKPILTIRTESENIIR